MAWELNDCRQLVVKTTAQFSLVVVVLEDDSDGVRDDPLPVPDGILGDAGIPLAHAEGQVGNAAVALARSETQKNVH